MSLAEQGKVETGGNGKEHNAVLPKPHAESVPFKMRIFLLLYKVPYKKKQNAFPLLLLVTVAY